MYPYIQKKKAKSIFVVLLLIFLGFSPVFVKAASLSISPSSGTYEVGETITVRAMVTSDSPLNAISGSILFPPSSFSVQSVSKSSSILNFWVTEPTSGKSSGVVRFEGVTLGGFYDRTGTVVTVSLKALNVGTAVVTFQNGQVLANDGEGTDITGSFGGATFNIIPATKAPPKETPPAPEEKQPAPTLNAPEIMRGSKFGSPAILGTSDYPNAGVLLTFTALDGVKVFITGQADSDGGFTLLVPNSLKRGTYSVTAVMIRSDKTNSAVSNTIIIEIGNIFSDIGWQIWLLILLLLLLILYLIWRIYNHFWKNKNIYKAIKREADEAEKVAHKSFDILREDIHDLEEDDKLGSAERRKISGIEKDLDSAEKVIDKEIEDIESV